MADFVPHVVVVDFHHARGPEIEFWVRDDGRALYNQNDWSLLPFMALSDGAHAMLEDFSYFTLLRKGGGHSNDPEQKGGDAGVGSSKLDTTLFGIACTRQIKSDKLKRKSTSVTRSTVQKSVCVITGTAQGLRQLRERLGAVTAAWFAQEDFYDTGILEDFQESLSHSYATDVRHHGFDLGLSLREIIHEFRHQTLVLVKCMLLQRKMLFFGSKCERLCMIQFALISLIPGLMKRLQDSASPSLDQYAQSVTRPSSLRTSDRESLLAYMGLPLNIFGKGSFFGPYTPLQHLDILADYDTKSYMVGSTNSLLLQQKERYSDLLVNLDESNSIIINSPSLRSALYLSAADRRWIDQLTATVIDTWDPENPSRPKTHGYAGSEDNIRLQFEEYILALLSSVAYKTHLEAAASNRRQPSPNPMGTSTPQGSQAHYTDPLDTSQDFNANFLLMWQSTNNYALFHKLTAGNHVFDIIEPRHPTAGALGVEDVQRRLQQTMADLNLDEKVREGRETLNKTFSSGKEKVNAGLNRLWAEWETRRASSRERGGEKQISGFDAGFANRRGSQSSTLTRSSVTQATMDGASSIDEKNALTSTPSLPPAAMPVSPPPQMSTSAITQQAAQQMNTTGAPVDPTPKPSTPAKPATESNPTTTPAQSQSLPPAVPSTPKTDFDPPNSSPPGTSGTGSTPQTTPPAASRAIPISALRSRTAQIRSNIANSTGHPPYPQHHQPNTANPGIGTGLSMNPYASSESDTTSPTRSISSSFPHNQPPIISNTPTPNLRSVSNPTGSGHRTISNSGQSPPSLFTIPPSHPSSQASTAPIIDTQQLQQTARENAAKAGAFLSSWGSWAKEKAVAATQVAASGGPNTLARPATIEERRTPSLPNTSIEGNAAPMGMTSAATFPSSTSTTTAQPSANATATPPTTSAAAAAAIPIEARRTSGGAGFFGLGLNSPPSSSSGGGDSKGKGKAPDRGSAVKTVPKDDLWGEH